MPARASRDTLARQWDLLKLLPSSGTGKTIAELCRALSDLGYTIQERQIERDLKQLEGVMPIKGHGSRPTGWRWVSGASRYITAMTLPEALSWQLADEALRPLLPLSMLKYLEPHFQEAARKLESLAEDNPAARWKDRVRMVQPSQPVIPPVIPEAVLMAVQDAVLKALSLRVSYRGYGAQSAQEMILHPVGLLQRGSVTYLAAMMQGYRDTRLYALHRMQSAEVLEASVTGEDFTPPPAPDLDKLMEDGLGQFSNGVRIVLEARIQPWLQQHLIEAPLSRDQVLTLQPDGDFLLRAEVLDSWQLSWWILSQGAGIEVLGPRALREKIRGTLREALGGYERRR